MKIAAATDSDARIILNVGLRYHVYMTIDREWDGDGSAGPRVLIGFDTEDEEFGELLVASGADYERIE